MGKVLAWDIERKADIDDISHALAGVATLVKMSHACIGKAHLRILMEQMGAGDSEH